MIKTFINKIRTSDEKSKRFWVFIFSGFTMAIVAALWAFYLDMSIVRLNPSGETQLAAAEGSGFFANLSSSFKNLIDKISTPLARKKTIIIENNQKDFLPKDLQPLPIMKLP